MSIERIAGRIAGKLKPYQIPFYVETKDGEIEIMISYYFYSGSIGTRDEPPSGTEVDFSKATGKGLDFNLSNPAGIAEFEQYVKNNTIDPKLKNFELGDLEEAATESAILEAYEQSQYGAPEY